MSSPSDARLPILTPEIGAYIDGLSGPEDELLDRLEQHAIDREFPLIGRTSGRWLELLTRSIQGKRVYEFGSGFGFSAYFFAKAVGPNGMVFGSEFDQWELDDHTRLYGDHPLSRRINIQKGSAFDILESIDGDFDVALIDIEKVDYPKALEAALQRVRPGGLIMADNVLWGGKTARTAAPDDEGTAALQSFNQSLFNDPRIQSSILPTGDGLSVSLVLP
ncbi:MAG: O-methyltransferase [Myxococcota bacterium]